MTAETGASGLSLARRGVVALAALVAATGVLAVALNRFPYDTRPSLAGKLWPGHPDTLHDQAMRDIGLAAAGGGTVPTSALNRMHRIAHLAPLDPDPFLVQATVVATAGDGASAERLFTEAAARDPRSVLAHYSLADRYLRTGRLSLALDELAVLARLVGSAANEMAEPIAAYALQPGTGPAMRKFFHQAPAYAGPVLAVLAKDPAQAERVMSLTQGFVLPPEASGWKSVLVQAQIERKDYPRALRAWQRVAGVGPFAGIYNPGFKLWPAPPPFNWTPVGGTAAMVEPVPGGGLKLVYYGREDSLLIQQLMVLAPGRYRLAMRIGDIPPRAHGNDDGVRLGWQLTCADGGPTLASLPLAGRAPGLIALNFAVPSGCPAQWIALHGTAGSFGEPVALTITAFSLTREGAR